MSRFSAMVLLAIAASAGAQTPVSVRILFGTTDAESTRWDGSIQVQGGKLTSIEPWRFEGTDSISGDRWQISTHPIRRFVGATAARGAAAPPVVANGIVVNLASVAATRLRVSTAQGDFELGLDEIPYGQPVTKLNGRAFADRIPPTVRVTASPEEEDFPAAVADADGNVWMAYVVFHHSPNHLSLQGPRTVPFENFAPLSQSTGGDQIVVRKYTAGALGPPIEVTGAGLDAYRTAIALDGRQRVWVFWSQNDKGNFDIHARLIANGRPGATVQICRDAGSDIDPVAATDSKGNVWVAWQGWRNGRAAIYSATQNGDRFSPPAAVSQSQANEWNPAIAAAKDGRVTIAWDSYRNGNYDVYLRTATPGGPWSAETPLAATARYEAYPSIAYDPAGRLWAAYEEGGRAWGKDFGAYDTSGLALYQGRVIRLIGIEPGGARVQVQADPGAVLPGVPNDKVDRRGTQSNSENFDPDTARAGRRGPAQAAANAQSARNNYPRLAIDGSGRLWLAYRSAYPVWWDPIGTVWTEHLTSFDGSTWTPSIYLHHTDNLLDNRPAIVPTRTGTVVVVDSSDNRRVFQPSAGAEVYNDDIWTSEISLGAASRAMAVKPAPVSQEASTVSPPEAAAIKRLRDYRSGSPSGYQIVRGEFHRHSEISMDGGNDGSILDQWRYILDAGALDWVGCCDHDNGNLREYTWWLEQKLTAIFYTPGVFVPMYSYERSVPYPEGHRNVIFVQRGIRPLPRLPITGQDAPGHAPDTQMLYAYLKHFDGVVASHTSATNMGTDWRDNDPRVEPVVEIYQGDRQNYEMPAAPRAPSENDSIGGWRPKGFVNLALERGYVLGFEASSDHISTHISYGILYVRERTREAVLEALKQRHVYAATDNILADVSSGTHMMGDVFTSASAPALQVKLTGTAKFARVHVIKDNAYVYSTQPNSPDVQFSWVDNSPAAGKTSYYYVRGEQEDGQIVWVSPMWITYRPK